MLELLGFTSPISTAWNGLAYAAFILIIIGVASDRYRDGFTMLGAFVLAIYAKLFLHNDVFALLQVLVCMWSGSQMLGFSREKSVPAMLMFTALTCAGLSVSGSITDTWTWIGSLGLLLIIIGLMALPWQSAFLMLAAGGVFLVIYAYSAGAWVFFFLNAAYVFVSAATWIRIDRENEARQ